MKAIKFTSLLLIILLYSYPAFAQKGSIYKIPATGETTIIVNAVQRDFDGPDNKFLKPDPRYSDTKTFLNKQTKLTSLEEAIYRTNDVMKNIDEAQAEITESNDALGFPLNIRLVKYNSSLRQARVIADSLIDIETQLSEKQIAAQMVKFGNLPTYYINGVEASETQAHAIKTTEVLSKEIKTLGTISGNPNGEIWIEVIPKAVERINGTNGKPTKSIPSLDTRTNNRELGNSSNKRNNRPSVNERTHEEPTYNDAGSDDDVPKRFRSKVQSTKSTSRSSSGTRGSARPRI